MILYHATHKRNEEKIIMNGIAPVVSEKISIDERLNQKAIYGFSNIQDAIDFMVYDNNTEIENVVIFTFETNNAIIDPEYDGNSFAAITEINIMAEVIK